MKRFTVKKKRAGGSYAPTGAEIYAMNLLNELKELEN